MRKSLIAVAIAGLFSVPTVVLAQAAAAPASPHTFTPNVGVASDYLCCRASQTRGRAAIQSGVDYSHSSGLYAAALASSIPWVSFCGDSPSKCTACHPCAREISAVAASSIKL